MDLKKKTKPTVDELTVGLTKGLPNLLRGGVAPDISELILPQGMGNEEAGQVIDKGVALAGKVGGVMAQPFRGASQGGGVVQDTFTFPSAPPEQINTAAQTDKIALGVNPKGTIGSNPNGIGPTTISDVYTPGSVVEKLAEVQTPLGTPSKTDTPIDHNQFVDGGGKGINYSLDAAGNVVAEAPTAKENPYDKDFKDTLDKIDLLNQSFVPAKSGYISDTIAENFDLVTRIKGLKERAAALQPMTTEGQGIPRANIAANAEKRLAPEQAAELQARTKVYEAQLADANKTELKDQQAMNEREKDIRKATQSYIDAGEKDPKVARKSAEAAIPVQIKSRTPFKDKNGNNAYMLKFVDGSEYPVDANGTPINLINPKTGKSYLENVGGIPQK